VNWDYKFTSEARRQLLALGPSVQAEIIAYLDRRIIGVPDPTAFGKPLRGTLKGYWRYRVRDWRVLCRIEKQVLVVVVVAVGHRSGVYEE
jgi:mRNA interferase RelE/StbE